MVFCTNSLRYNELAAFRDIILDLETGAFLAGVFRADRLEEVEDCMPPESRTPKGVHFEERL